MVGATNKRLAPSEEADMAWHTHIIHTQLYSDFCHRHFGRFLHHVPSDPTTHPPESVLKKQNQLGRLFFGKNTIYVSASGCVNSHPMCHQCGPVN
jgi:hypothetical protein